VAFGGVVDLLPLQVGAEAVVGLPLQLRAIGFAVDAAAIGCDTVIVEVAVALGLVER